MFERIEIFDKRYSELNRRLYEPDVAADPAAYQKVMKEIKSIEEIVLTYRDYKKALQSERDSLEILNDNSDLELKELAQLELEEAKEQIASLSEQLKLLLLPKDPNDERNVIVERRCCSACIPCTPSAAATRSRCSTPMRPSWAATRRSPL